MSRVISAVLTLKDRDFTSNAKKATGALTDTQRQAKHAQNTVKGFGKSAANGFRSVAKGAASLAGAIGIVKGLSGAFNMIRSSMDSAFRRIDTMEQFDRTMTTLTGSAESAAAALDATNDAVVGTAYGLDVAAKGVQDFVTRGMEVDKATGVIEAFGDAVAFYGEGSNEQLASVSDALAKMYSTGKVHADQMNRLYDAGIDAVGMYAQATDQSTETVQSALSDGSISAEEFIDTVTEAMMEGTGGVENISGAAKEAGASWGASWDNMRAAVARGVTNVIESIDEMLEKNGLPDMRGMISNLGGAFESTLGKAADKIPAVAGMLVSMYESAKPGIDWIKDTGIPGIKDTFVDLKERVQPVIDWMKNDGMEMLKEGIKGALDEAKNIYNFFVDNWSLISPVIAGVASGVLAFKAGVMLTSGVMRVWQGVTAAVTLATSILNGTLAISPLGWVAIAIGAVIAVGVLLWKNWDWITEKASALWGALKSWFGDLKDSIVRWWGNVIDKGVELWQGFLGIRDKAGEMAGSVKTRILDMKDKVVGWFGDLKDGAVERFEDIIQAAKDLPGKIGQGIKDFASKAWEGIKELADGLVTKFKEALGIESPSTVFFDMAKWIVEGLVNGLSASNLLDLGKNMFSGFAEGAFNTLKSIKGFFTGMFGGGEVSGNVSSWIRSAMNLTGVPDSWFSPLSTIAMKESGGRTGPSTINRWDSNWHRGTPSMGLMQTIRPTFDAYKMSGMNDIMNPIHNAVAAIRYIQARYGSPFNTPGIRSMSQGGPYKGYWTGGRITSSNRYLVGERGPELVDLPAGSKVNNAQNSKGQKGNVTINIDKIIAAGITVEEVLNELVPQLKLRLANL